MNKLILLLFIATVLIACEDTVKFETPQPSKKSNLNKFPGKLRGTYYSNSDNTYLTITEQQVIEWVEFVTKTAIDSLNLEIDSTKIKHRTSDSIQINGGHYNLNLDFFSQDSVNVYYSYRDTLFKISEENILRRFKGHHFLNHKKAEKNWKVRRLSLDKSKLSFAKVGAPENLEELSEITEVEKIKSDSGMVVGYKLNPSRKELKQLMKHRFSETSSYQKIK